MNREHYNPETLRCARLSAGFATQTDVASKLGVAVKTINRAEAGRSASYELLYKMAGLYLTDVRAFLHPQKNLPQKET